MALNGADWRMAVTADVVFQEALQLSEDTRIDLIERLIISTASYREIEHEQLSIAQTRLAEMKSGAVKGVLAEDALIRASRN